MIEPTTRLRKQKTTEQRVTKNGILYLRGRTFLVAAATTDLIRMFGENVIDIALPRTFIGLEHVFRSRSSGCHDVI